MRVERATVASFRNALIVLAVAAAAQAAAEGAARDFALLALGLAAIRLAGLAVFRLALPAIGARPPRIAEDVAEVVGYVAWGLVRLRLAGLDLSGLVTTSAVITAVAAFAMQDTLGNVLGGLFLEFDRSISIGDWIRLDDLTGRVTEIRWRHTAIRTRNGELAIVPNSALMKSRFTVIGNPDKAEVRWRRWVWFEVGTEVPAGRVLAAAGQALAGAEVAGVAAEPAPSCVLMEVKGDDCRYALRYWLSDPQPDDATDSAVRVHLVAALRRSGIELAIPAYVIHQVKENESRRSAQREHEMQARVAALRAVDLFAGLDDAELRALAGHLVPAPFAAGDVMTRQGAVAHWLYLLVGGEAEVWFESPEAPRRRVAALGPGSVFGEMGMMTGEPRGATVTARTDVECYRLDKAGFEGILRSRPAIAEGISRVLASRLGGLRHAAEEAQAQAAAARLRPESLLARIRAFFGLAGVDAGQGAAGGKP
jgi:small-conductance mechanosensitive channel/CRP-like cAMP-binding protein